MLVTGHRVYINTFIYCRLEQDLSMSQNAYLHPGVATPLRIFRSPLSARIPSTLTLDPRHIDPATTERERERERSYPRLNT